MYTTLSVLALAASVSANYGLLQNGAPYIVKRELMARQTESTVPSATLSIPSAADTQCLDALLSLYSSVPTPPPEIISYELTASQTQTDPCSFSVPDPLTSAFSSYESEALAWYTSNSDAINSALSKCPDYSSYATAGPAACSPTDSAGGSGGGSSGGSGGSGSGSGDQTSSRNAGPRETGLVGAGMLLAGFVGAVVAL